MSAETANNAASDAKPEQTATEEVRKPTEEQNEPEAPAPTRELAEKLVAEGRKAIALKQWEEGVGKFADALDIMRPIVGDMDPAMAPILLAYGKALYELALSQSGVMGKEEVEKGTQGQLDDAAGPSTLVESADPEIIAAAEAEEAAAATAAETTAEEEEQEEEQEGGAEGEGEGDDEPEDDFNAAWEVLDVARTIYAKEVEDKKARQEEVKGDELSLAECYLLLGDVSCETENFPQAVSDYTSALKIQSTYLPAASRTIASAHFQLGTVLDFLPGRRAEALSHINSAIDAFRLREAQLSSSSSLAPVVEGQEPLEELSKLSAKEREAELKETKELIGDLEAKVEELKSAPEKEDLVTEGIRHFMGAVGGAADAFGAGPSGSSSVGGAAAESKPVNDLTGMVKKKKKPVAAAAAAAIAPAVATAQAAATEAAEAVQGVVEQVKRGVADTASSAAEVGQGVVEGAKRELDALGDEAEGPSKKAKVE